MKRLFVPFVFAGLLSVPAAAQTDKPSAPDSVKPLLKIPSPGPDGMKTYPQDPLLYRKMPRSRVPVLPDSARARILAEKQSPQDNMPILRSYRPYRGDRMPVYKPDSTIDFKLKIKKPGRSNLSYQPK